MFAVRERFSPPTRTVRMDCGFARSIARRRGFSSEPRARVFRFGLRTVQIDLSRRKVSKVCDVNGVCQFSGGTWLDDGRILFASRNTDNFVGAATGGVGTPAALVDFARGDATYVEPHFALRESLPQPVEARPGVGRGRPRTVLRIDEWKTDGRRVEITAGKFFLWESKIHRRSSRRAVATCPATAQFRRSLSFH